MSGTAIVSEIVNILVSGITQLGSGIGTGVSQFAQALAFSGTGENQQLSVFFVLIIVFAGVSLAIGLTRLIFSWLQGLGN